MAIDEDVYVKALEGSIEDMIPNYLDLIHEINSNLFDTISARNTKTTSAQTDGRINLFSSINYSISKCNKIYFLRPSKTIADA